MATITKRAATAPGKVKIGGRTIAGKTSAKSGAAAVSSAQRAKKAAAKAGKGPTAAAKAAAAKARKGPTAAAKATAVKAKKGPTNTAKATAPVKAKKGPTTTAKATAPVKAEKGSTAAVKATAVKAKKGSTATAKAAAPVKAKKGSTTTAKATAVKAKKGSTAAAKAIAPVKAEKVSRGPLKTQAAVKKDVAASYNRYKIFGGEQYTGMKIGGTHKWYYDKGEWKETKVTPDLWRISYAVTKRRAGKAPKGSGAAVGTGYQWYIAAHQHVEKLNANDYSTVLSGLKYKLSHKRAGKDKWSAKAATQRKHLIQFLKDMIHELEEKVVPLEFEYNGIRYKGEAVPVPGTCHDGVCFELDVTLNDLHMGIIRSRKSGWKMERADDQKLVNAIGEEIMLYYE